MTVLTKSSSAELLSGLRTGDEQALEHGFQEAFPAMLAEADATLHDLPTSARVVERAFLQVLAEPPVDDEESLDRALDRAIQHSLAREQSRQAALRRFEHNEHVSTPRSVRRVTEPVGAAQAWKHIHDARDRAGQARTQPDSREDSHRAAEHLATALKPRSKWSIPLLVLGLIALCAAAYGVIRIDPRPSEAFINAQLNSSNAKSIGASAGRVGSVSLTDGTQLRIAAGSTVKVINNFGDPVRAISLQGAASMTIAADKNPLEIRAAGVAISAKEGQLDLRAEEGRPTVVRVVQGAPKLRVGDSSWVATAGQVYAIDKGIRAATPAEIDESFAWMEGRFVVNGTVRDVVGAFRRWYDVDVGIGDNSIAEWPAQVNGSLESFTSSMLSLEQSAKVRMEWQNRHMLLFRR